MLPVALLRRRAPDEDERTAARDGGRRGRPSPRRAPRPDPAPRPWLELELKAERASATDAETLVQFELEITNTGKAPARNLRIDVKMFNAGEEQDQEIGTFFRTAGRESTKCHLPGIAPGMTGVIHGEVAMPRDEMRAVVLDDKYLFIPVLAVNALYDWGEGRTGQTSKSYVVGRELEQPSEKMGAFRVDSGPAHLAHDRPAPAQAGAAGLGRGRAPLRRPNRARPRSPSPPPSSPALRARSGRDRSAPRPASSRMNAGSPSSPSSAASCRAISQPAVATESIVRNG